MSDLYRLASALRQADSAILELLIHERSLDLSEFKDFFDLAHAILTPKSQALMAASITTTSLSSLRSLAAQEKVSKDQTAILSNELLVWSAQEPVVYDWLLDRLTENPRTTSLSVVSEHQIDPDQKALDSDGGIHAFEAMQAVTELIFDFDQHLVREVSRGSLGLPDVKRTSLHIGKTKDYVKGIFELSKIAGLLAVSERRFQPTALADEWMNQTPRQRWTILAKVWLQLAGTSGSKELSNLLNQFPNKPLSELIRTAFPFASGAPASRINRLAELAEIIGISSGGLATSWLGDTLNGRLIPAAKALESKLPAQQQRIIIQGDLSIVTPGPLDSQLEIQLRKFADTESIGLASSYRLSAKSISCGLEEGLSEDQIRNLLKKLSETTLPQPVDYLIRETSERFGRIQIQPAEKGSLVQTSDEFMAKQLAMDSKLKTAMFSQGEKSMTSPLDAQTLYHSLRENGYLAVLVNQSGFVISPSSLHKTTNQSADLNEQLERLRAQDVEMADAAPATDMERKILLALKTKSSLNVEINANGKTMSFLLEPIGIANGRLRARDRKADIERTLPVSAITSILIG